MGVTKQIKKYLTIWPIIFIFSIWFLFASPYFFKGNVPFPSTYQVNNFAPWNTNSQFWGPVKNGAMPDIITQIYPWKYLAIEIWKTGQVPLWNPYTFSGNPLLANYQSGVFSPFNVLFFVLPFIDAWSILVLFQPLLAGLFMYLFVKSLKVGKIGSLVSAISFMFCGFITSWMSYATLGYAIVFLPLSLFCIEKYSITKKNIFLILLSLTIPLSFFSGHFQISLYFLITILAYVIYKFIISRNIRDALFVILYICFGVLLIMPQVLPSIELYLESFRSSFFQKGGGIPLEYIPTFLAPDFFGNPVTRNTWLGNYAEWNAYIGVLPLMLAIYSISRIKKPQIFFLFIFGISVLILGIDSPISNFVVNLNFPVLSTSSINRIIILYSFAFTVLAGFGYDYLLLDIKNAKKKRILLWIGLVGLIFIVLWGLIALKLLIPLDKIVISRQNLMLPTILFLGSSIIIVCGVVFRRIKHDRVLYIAIATGFTILLTADMLRFATKWQPFDPKSLVFPNVATTEAFSKISRFDRTIGNFGGEASIYYKLPSVEGYDALYSKRYGEFIGFIDNGEIIKSAWSVVSFSRDSVRTEKALNLLDIKYIVHKLLDNKKSWTFPFWIYPKDQFKLIYKDSKYEFYENMRVLSRAFLVGKYRVIKDQKKILETIFSNDFDPSKEIILEDNPGINMTEGDMGVAQIINYQPNNIEISVDSKSNALLFLTDSYYNGWKASVNGKDIPILRANYAFRAIQVEKGRNTVKFYYDPLSFKLGVYLAIGGLIGILFMILISKNTSRSKSFSFLQTQKDK